MRNYIVTVISFLLALLFVYAAVSKLLDYDRFIFQLSRSPYTTSWARQAAWMIPSAELLITILLTGSKSRLTGLYASFSLMLLFTCYIYAILHYSYYIPCSCGGILSKMGWHEHMLFNIAATMAAIIAVIFYPGKNITHSKYFARTTGDAENLQKE